MTIRTQGAVFAPEAVITINRAYGRALEIIGRRRTNSGGQTVRVKLAEVIMGLARQGECEEEILIEKALVQVTAMLKFPDETLSAPSY